RWPEPVFRLRFCRQRSAGLRPAALRARAALARDPCGRTALARPVAQASESKRDLVFEAPTHRPAWRRLSQAEEITDLVFDLAVRREIVEADKNRPNAVLRIGERTGVVVLVDLAVILEP